MIVDKTKFKTLSKGSNHKVLCRCDDCKTERYVYRFNIRNNEYKRCNVCSLLFNRCEAREVSKQERKARSKSWKGKGNPKWNPDREYIQALNKTRKWMYGTIKRVLGKTGKTKEATTIEYLDYSPNQLRKSIESKFKEGMSWSNRHTWHIDHVKPIAAFVKDKIFDPGVINALSNLQPMWCHENLIKGAN